MTVVMSDSTPLTCVNAARRGTAPLIRRWPRRYAPAAGRHGRCAGRTPRSCDEHPPERDGAAPGVAAPTSRWGASATNASAKATSSRQASQARETTSGSGTAPVKSPSGSEGEENRGMRPAPPGPAGTSDVRRRRDGVPDPAARAWTVPRALRQPRLEAGALEFQRGALSGQEVDEKGAFAARGGAEGAGIVLGGDEHLGSSGHGRHAHHHRPCGGVSPRIGA